MSGFRTATALGALHWILEEHACLDLGSASERFIGDLEPLLPVSCPHRRQRGLCADNQECGRPHVPAGRPQNAPLLALVLGFRPRPRALALGSWTPPASRSLFSPASLLVFRCGAFGAWHQKWPGWLRTCGAGQTAVRPGLRPPTAAGASLVMGRGVEGIDVAAKPGPATVRPEARSAGTQLRGLHLHVVGLEPG